MFKQARIKLTVVYLGIIMVISLCFSVFIYRMVSFEIQDRLSTIQRRLYLDTGDFFHPPPQGLIFVEDLKEAEAKVRMVLIYTNFVILFFSAVAGYILAGITLKPIEISMEEQKRFIADASHELKTPLTALQTSIEVALRDKKITLKDALFTLSDSLNDVKNMTDLTKDLLSLTRYQQNGLKNIFEKVNLKEVITESLKRIKPLAKKKKIIVEFSGSETSVLGSRDDLEKLITILLDNAVKYTPNEGKVWVELSLKGKSAIISVSDNGIGIEKKDVPLIFERFFRADVSRSKVNATGYGLGLSIAKKITEIHHGSIDVDSYPGRGSTFTVKLPI